MISAVTVFDLRTSPASPSEIMGDRRLRCRLPATRRPARKCIRKRTRFRLREREITGDCARSQSPVPSQEIPAAGSQAAAPNSLIMRDYEINEIDETSLQPAAAPQPSDRSPAPAPISLIVRDYEINETSSAQPSKPAAAQQPAAAGSSPQPRALEEAQSRN